VAPPSANVAAAPGRLSLFDGKLRFWLLWPLLVALDLWSKYAAFEFLFWDGPINRDAAEQAREHVVFGGPVTFSLVSWRNPGTIWGLFGRFTGALIIIRCLALAVLIWFVRKTPAQARVQLLVLSLIFAGAIGNLYDNFFARDGMVRDFLRFSGSWPVAWDFPAFNVADSCITVGAIGLVLLLMREDRASARTGGEVSSRS
jgi:signal peptidase II